MPQAGSGATTAALTVFNLALGVFGLSRDPGTAILWNTSQLHSYELAPRKLHLVMSQHTRGGPGWPWNPTPA